MDLSKIKEIVNDPNLSNEDKQVLILDSLSKDKNVVSYLLVMLENERRNSKEIIEDLNLEVSRYNVHINNPAFLRKNKAFLNEETNKMYKKWKGFIEHCFKSDDA